MTVGQVHLRIGASGHDVIKHPNTGRKKQQLNENANC